MKEFVRLIIKKNNKFLLIKEIKGNFYNAWNFPGGKVEESEKPEEAVIREIREEINMYDLKIKKLFDTTCVFNNETWHGYYFLNENINLDTLKILETTKCDGYCFFCFDEIKTLNLGIPTNVLKILEKKYVNSDNI